MPLFEKVVADHPDDIIAKQHCVLSMGVCAATLSDPEVRKKVRSHAHILAVE
jgi:hypothetical protein